DRLQEAEHVREPQPDETDVTLLKRPEHELFLPVHGLPASLVSSGAERLRIMAAPGRGRIGPVLTVCRPPVSGRLQIPGQARPRARRLRRAELHPSVTG